MPPVPTSQFRPGPRATQKIALLLVLLCAQAALAVSAFAPQLRLGYRTGGQWEPAVAPHRHGHLYVLYPQYGAVPGCAPCTAPSMDLRTRGDNGASWDSSKPPL